MKKFLVIFLFLFIFIFLGSRACYNHYQSKNIEMSPPKTVGVLVIVIGRYNLYWEGFYKSCEKYFLPGYKKDYFVFTDDKKLKFRNKKNVKIIYQKKERWPYSTLLRYQMFLNQKETLKKYDYLFFFNINILFKQVIGKEVLPNEKHDGLVVCNHHRFFNKNPYMFTYDRNPRSTAYIPYGQGYVYVAGGLNGGTSEAFLKMAEVCNKNIQTDLKNGVIAEWHDESHINKYILDKHPLILPINYLYPVKTKWFDRENEKYYLQDIKIALLNKANYGGYFYLRGQTDIKSTPFNRFKYKMLEKYTKDENKRREYRNILRMLYFRE